MSDINSCVVAGRLVRDPEVRRGNSGTSWATFSIAANHKYKAGDTVREEVAFVSCISFGKPAEWCASHKRGDHVVVNGRLRTSSWEKDGQKHSRLELVVDNARFYPAQVINHQNGSDSSTPVPESDSTDAPPF
jgi:single-strand DNA-binding protein